MNVSRDGGGETDLRYTMTTAGIQLLQILMADYAVRVRDGVGWGGPAHSCCWYSCRTMRCVCVMGWGGGELHNIMITTASTHRCYSCYSCYSCPAGL